MPSRPRRILPSWVNAQSGVACIRVCAKCSARAKIDCQRVANLRAWPICVHIRDKLTLRLGCSDLPRCQWHSKIAAQ